MSNCYFQVSVAGYNPRKIVLKLDTKTCPKTCENFLSFCNKPKDNDTKSNFKSYTDTIFHRIIPGFMVQGGDYENGDGTGGQAYAGGVLKDECFDMKHDRPFILSMANRGKNTAGSQFFITLGKASHLDGKHVAFGEVIEGQDVIRDMEKVETDDKDKPVPMQRVKIVEAGIGDGNDNDDSEDSEDEGKEAENHKSKKSDRKSRKKSSKRKYNSSDSESDHDDDRSASSSIVSTSSSERHHKRRRHRKKKHRTSKKESKKHHRHRRHRKSSYSSDDNDDDDISSSSSSVRRKKPKHRKRKKEKHDSDDSYDSESSTSSSRRDRKRRKKHRKSKKDKKSRKKKSRNEKESSKARNDNDAQEKNIAKNSFGMYGIVKESDFRTSTKVKRNFEIWLEEVKGVPQGTNVPKWELSESFKEYAEDFNTATLPHIKYYDYDKWEMEEYKKKKEESESKKGAKSDEFQYQEERRKQAEDKRRKELDLVRITMSKNKIEEMKRQSRMKAEMVNAYRVGDEEKRKKLQKRLEPDEK